MKRTVTQRLFIGLVLAVTTVGMVGAVAPTPPKAKNAPGSVAIEAPERMVSYFEDNGVDMARFRASGEVDQQTADAMYKVYVAEDSVGDRIHSGRINGIALGALAAKYDEVQNPVYLEFGPFYWGNWREKDGLSESDF
jgi:hypothetical protein